MKAMYSRFLVPLLMSFSCLSVAQSEAPSAEPTEAQMRTMQQQMQTMQQQMQQQQQMMQGAPGAAGPGGPPPVAPQP
mgnify:CR=1 FL=1